MAQEQKTRGGAGAAKQVGGARAQVEMGKSTDCGRNGTGANFGAPLVESVANGAEPAALKRNWTDKDREVAVWFKKKIEKLAASKLVLELQESLNGMKKALEEHELKNAKMHMKRSKQRINDYCAQIKTICKMEGFGKDAADGVRMRDIYSITINHYVNQKLCIMMGLAELAVPTAQNEAPSWKGNMDKVMDAIADLKKIQKALVEIDIDKCAIVEYVRGMGYMFEIKISL